MKSWPAPTDIPHTFQPCSTPFTFDHPLSDSGTLRVMLANIAQFTGDPDSWELSISASWPTH